MLSTFSFLPPQLFVFILGTLPSIGVRFAIPIGIAGLEMHPLAAYFWATLGNILPVFFLLFFLKRIFSWFDRNVLLARRIFAYLFAKTRKNYGKKLEKYGYLALFIFAAIPLPATGAWGASLAVFLFGLSYKKSMIAIISGIMVAGAGVLLFTETGIAVEKYYGKEVLLGIIMFALFLYFLYYWRKANGRKNE